MGQWRIGAYMKTNDMIAHISTTKEILKAKGQDLAAAWSRNGTTKEFIRLIRIM